MTILETGSDQFPMPFILNHGSWKSANIRTPNNGKLNLG